MNKETKIKLWEMMPYVVGIEIVIISVSIFLGSIINNILGHLMISHGIFLLMGGFYWLINLLLDISDMKVGELRKK